MAVTVVVTAAYALALTVNSIGGADGLAATLLLNAVGRSLASAAVLAALLLWRGASAAPVLLDGRALPPFCVAVASNTAYLAFYTLMARSSLSAWPAALGLATAIPVVYGLCFRGERASARKLLAC